MIGREMRNYGLPLALLLISATVPLAQQQPAAPPTLPPPGSLTTPPAAPNPLVPAAPVAPPAASNPQQPPGTLPQTQEQMKTPEIGGPTEMMLESRPVILLRGQSTWDDGFENLMESFQKLRDEAAKRSLPTVGRPQAAFTATDDFGFKFEAMLVLTAEPGAPPAGLAKEFVIGKSPSGKTLKFTHNGAYDDIDTTYEAITAYLDEKGLKARNIFVEEYMNDPKTSEDAVLEMNIYVLVE
jgi:effector-binding domain-containing protein